MRDRLSFQIFLVLMMTLLAVSNAEASCSKKMIALAAGLSLTSGLKTTNAAFIQDGLKSPNQKTFEFIDLDRFPYERLRFIRSEEPLGEEASLTEQSSEALELFEDYEFYFEPEISHLIRSYDRHQNLEINTLSHPQQTSIRGPWFDRIWLPANVNQRDQSAKGIVTVYGNPNTPGLYQFIVIDYTQGLLGVSVTHYAWKIEPPIDDNLTAQSLTENQIEPVPIPSTIWLALIAGSSITQFRPRR